MQFGRLRFPQCVNDRIFTEESAGIVDLITSAGAGPFLHAYHATKRQSKSSKSIGQEGRILLAIKSIQNGRISVVAAAARSFNVPRTTLADRMKGIPNLYEARATGHKFTQLEEESI